MNKMFTTRMKQLITECKLMRMRFTRPSLSPGTPTHLGNSLGESMIVGMTTEVTRTPSRETPGALFSNTSSKYMTGFNRTGKIVLKKNRQGRGSDWKISVRNSEFY